MSKMIRSAQLLLGALVLLFCGSCARSDGEPGGLSPMVPSTSDPAPTVSTVSLRISNQSTEVICGIYVAPAGSGEWGDNLLGRAIIEPGGAAAVEVAPGVYDLRAVNCFDVPLAEAPGVDVSTSFGWRIAAEDLHDQ